MSVNLYKPHVLVLPEDDANRQLANGFLKDPALNLRAIQVLPVEGGWSKVRDAFVARHQEQMRNYPFRHLVLLIDFDEQVEDRFSRFKDCIPADVSERVFLLGTCDEPEPLRKDQGTSLEKLGEQLARACAEGRPGLWAHHMLQHNQPELERLTNKVKPFLFS